MNIYYRGYVIHEDIRAICYTVYGRRPLREEEAVCSTAQNAMRWVDREVTRSRTAEPVLPAAARSPW